MTSSTLSLLLLFITSLVLGAQSLPNNYDWKHQHYHQMLSSLKQLQRFRAIASEPDCTFEQALACVNSPASCPAQCTSFTCDPNQVAYATATGQRGANCYYAIEPKPSTHIGYTFNQAVQNCEANGTLIASVHSAEEDQFVFEQLIKGSIGYGNHHYFWIALTLNRDPVTGAMIGAQNADGTPVSAYENPMNPQSPPWAPGQPDNIEQDENCVHIYAFGKFRKLWEAYNCNEGPYPDPVPYLPSNGYICKGCPAGWHKAPFNGHCYKAFVSEGSASATATQLDQLCANFGATAASVHSAEENQLVLDLVKATGKTLGFVYIGLRLTRDAVNSGLVFGAIASRDWTDGSNTNIPSTFGYTTGTLADAGTFPWAAGGAYSGGRGQPDNVPTPSDVFDESLPKRPWDNFHFVEFHALVTEQREELTMHQPSELAFAVHSLLEIPDQYNTIRKLGMLLPTYYTRPQPHSPRSYSPKPQQQIQQKK